MIVGDILDEKTICEAIDGADIVFNYTGLTDINKVAVNPMTSVKINILANISIFECCLKYYIERYIFASSLYVYGNSGGFYRCSKQAYEIFIENYHTTYNISSTILRYGSLYGSRANNYSDIERFIHEALTKKRITYYGSKNALCEYLHVDDASDATLAILDPEFSNQNIIISGSQPIRMSDLFQMISEIIEYEIDVEYKYDKIEDIIK